MNYFELGSIEDQLKIDLESINEFENVDHFIDAHFVNGVTCGEYWDNTLETSYEYKMYKSIEADKEFLSKFKFMLDKYVMNAKPKPYITDTKEPNKEEILDQLESLD